MPLLKATRVHPDTKTSAFEQVRIIDPDREVGAGDRLSYLFEGVDPIPRAREALPVEAAWFFLTEPLYAAAGNQYELANWVIGLLFDPGRDRCFGLAYELWCGGWQLWVGREALLLCQMDM